MIRRTPSIQNEHVIIPDINSSDIEPHFWSIVWLPAKSSMSFPNVSLMVVSDMFTPWKQCTFLYWSWAYKLKRSKYISIRRYTDTLCTIHNIVINFGSFIHFMYLEPCQNKKCFRIKFLCILLLLLCLDIIERFYSCKL